MAVCGGRAHRILGLPLVRRQVCGLHQLPGLATSTVQTCKLLQDPEAHSVGKQGRFYHGGAYDVSLGGGLLTSIRLARNQPCHSTDASAIISSGMIIEKMLDEVGDLTRVGTDASEISSRTILLMKSLYCELAKEEQWLQTKPIVAYIQLLLKNKLEPFTNVVRQHENFPVLYSLLNETYLEFSNGLLAESLLSLLYLGVEPVDSLITKMFLESRARIHTFDFAALKSMSYVSLALSRLNDSLSVKEIIKRWKDLLRDETLQWNAEILGCHCMLGSNHSGILSTDLLKEASEKVLEVLNKDDELLQEPEIIGTVLRFARIMGQQRRGPQLIPREITAKVVAVFPSHIHKFKAIHIAECCSALKFLRCYSESLAAMFEEKALELLASENSLRDITNLMYALTRLSSQNIRTKFMMELSRNLVTTTPDLILLSSLADSFYHMGYVPQYILRLFQKSVGEQAGNIISHQSRYLRITRFLGRSQFLEPSHKEMFMDKLLEHLEYIHGISMPVTTNLTVFLLTLSEEPLSEKVFSSLMEQIPRWHVVGPSYRLALGLNNMPRPVSILLQKQVSEIQAALYSNLIDKMTDVSLDKLYLMTIGLVVNSRNRDPFFTDQIMHMFLKYTKSLLDNFDDVAMAKIITVFGSIKYKLPEVFDDLASFVIKYQDTLDPEKVVSVLKACAGVGYLPKRYTEFQEVVLKTYNWYKEEGNILKMLSILHFLSHLQLLPEKELGDLFSLEGIEKVDKWLSEYPDYKKVVEHYMLSLNRAVVIELPQLDVPWFHDLENGTTAVESSRQPKFCTAVQLFLTEILGGDEFVHSPSYSYYGNSMSLEINLDSEKNPLPVTPAYSWKDSGEVDRVAIQTYGQRSFCCNSSDLGGWQKTNKRQLEIMGYRVIGIPHFEWFSMSLADHDSKLDYLRGKIFDNEDLD